MSEIAHAERPSRTALLAHRIAVRECIVYIERYAIRLEHSRGGLFGWYDVTSCEDDLVDDMIEAVEFLLLTGMLVTRPSCGYHVAMRNHEETQ